MSNSDPALVLRAPLDDASFLSFDALTSLLHASLDGVIVADSQRRYRYANPAACRTLGYSCDELLGRDFLLNFAERERDGLVQHFQECLSGLQGVWKTTAILPDGTERYLEYSNMQITVGGEPFGAAIFRDVTETHRIKREGVALAEIATRVAYGGSLQSTLEALCAHVVEATNIVAASVALKYPDKSDLRVVGSYGYEEGYQAAINKVFASGVSLPSTQAFENRRPAVSRNIRPQLLADPDYALAHEFIRRAAWDTVVAVPMLYGNDAVGVLIGYYPLNHEASDAEINFLAAIASQAAVAVENARLLAEVQSKAAVDERARLARELHDSVTQALFSINLTARSLEVSVDREHGRDALKQKLGDLKQLTQGALAEMRALIFELRPGALEEEGLIQALRKHTAAVQGRDLLAVDLRVEPDFPRLDPAVEEALYRIAQEALHNTVKHSRASEASVTLEMAGGCAVLQVTDNGTGFDAALVLAGHMGLENMRQRAEALGGDCLVESEPGKGTTVTARVPV